MNHGLLIILSSPSGAGKTSVCQSIIQKDPHISLSISATTRTPRSQETHGKEYFFLSHEEFDIQRQQNAFLEHAEVFGNNYGTPFSFVHDQHAAGKDVLFDIDWQGARTIQDVWRLERDIAGIVTIFLLPPSLEELEQRLRGRGQDDEKTILSRMDRARSEVSHWEEYEYVLINHTLDQTISDVQAIITTERLKRLHQPHLAEWIKPLL